MNMRTKISAAGVIAALLTQAISAHAAGEAIGINAAIKGDVTIQTGEQLAKQAIIREEVFLGDAITSKQQSSLQVLLKDQTTFTVGEDCELVIDKFVYDPNAKANALSANVTKGMFRFMSGNISKTNSDDVNIDTPVASMGVRGTIVEGLVGLEAIEYAKSMGIIDPSMTVDPQGATLFILRGPGPNSRANNAKGEIRVTSAGQTVTMRESGTATFVPNRNSPPIPPFELPADMFENFNVELRTKPTLDGPSFEPFVLDEFMEYEASVQTVAGSAPAEPTPTEAAAEPETNHPSELFDLPSGIEDVLSCTPNSPNYPSCLFGGGNSNGP